MAELHPGLTVRCLSSLTKVFPDQDLSASEVRRGETLLGEVHSFQVAYYSDRLRSGLGVRVESDIPQAITVYRVGLVPSELPWRDDYDADVLRTTPGLFPDPLYPVVPAVAPEERRVSRFQPAGGRSAHTSGSGHLPGVTAFPEQWRSIWIRVVPPAGAAGIHRISVVFETADGEEAARAVYDLDIIDAELPPQQLSATMWFHTDCLATYYGVDIFSEQHWKLIEAYAAEAADHGLTMILTPLFTPPLDTAVGSERPTVQLVDIQWNPEEQRYSFAFSKLRRWVEICDRVGIRSFEFSHLFTQWGAAHCPKIVASVAGTGTEERIFGWHTSATSPEYRLFLDQFLPALVDYIRDAGLQGRCYFHVSDEPRIEHLQQYQAAREIVKSHLQGFPIMDALSNYQFYADGVVDLPVPATNHIEPFIEHNVRPLWTYYCVSQRREVSNRFFSMPSSRNRILGAQLYKYDVAGFLQWGYNFWYSQFSAYPIDPYSNTDAGYAFPSGDAFAVYPGSGGPVTSVRFEVFREALQDLRAFRLLESLVGRQEALQVVEGDGELTFAAYPRGTEAMLALRCRVNNAIRSARTGAVDRTQ